MRVRNRKFALRVMIVIGALAVLGCNIPALAGRPPVISPHAPFTPSATIPLETATATLSPSPTVIPTIPYTPIFEPAACQFGIPEGTSSVCGWLTVPEDRTRPGGRIIRLHVAVFRSFSPNPAPDPVIFLSGGPGTSALRLVNYSYGVGFGQLLISRDLVIFDQRGTGYSEPGLYCPERIDAVVAILEQGLRGEQARALEVDAYSRCRGRLIGEGVDLAAYDSAASAADVNDLRIALGYDQVNLYGVSYGTRLALTVMRDYPEHIRSVILDSTYPPQVDLYAEMPANAQRAFSELFAACAADSGCSAAYPNLENAFYGLVRDLDASPVTMSITDPSNGTPRIVQVNGGVLMDVVFEGLYPPFFIPRIPLLIYELRNGNFNGRLPARLQLMFSRDNARGMQASVQCREETPFSGMEAVRANLPGVREEIGAWFEDGLQTWFAICEAWGAGASNPLEDQPVTSNIPTLILAGRFDPITPPAWGYQTAELLPNSFVYEFPDAGHWLMRSNTCALGIGMAFIENPSVAPDSSCISLLSAPNFE